MMRVTYDSHTDTLTIVFRDALIDESDEDKPGMIFDYDSEGNVVSMEILNATRRVENPRLLEFRTSD